MDDEMREVIEEFLVESHENLDRIDREFVALEQNPDDRAVLASVFRTVHTIKGTSGFLGFERLEQLAHVGENLMSKLRDGDLRLTSQRTDALLAMVDAVREMLACVEANGTDGDRDYVEVVRAIESAMDDTVSAGGGSLEFFGPPATQPPTAPPPAAQSPTAQPVVSPMVPDPARALATDSTGNAAESSIRVDVSLLDELVNLVGELVLARNQLLRHANAGQDQALSAAMQQLDMITTELQEGVMRTRMQPIGNVWAKFPRVVRDLSAQVEKRVRLEMEGKSTELDKSVLEAIKDPLTHIVRNAVDHGIEGPEARAAAGKDHEGVLRLRAFHEGGLVNIEITDDGRGLDPERIKAKAVERGVVSSDRAAAMGDRDAIELLFQPGFSTADSVSNISGRGVGMDVVRTNIERIGGTVDLESRIGEGTTVRIKIPLTLAIIPALIVTTGGERFAIPQVNLLELARLEGDRAQREIEYVHDVPVYRSRGRLLPIVTLAQELGVRSQSDGRATNIVVLQADGREFGLVVDEINDTAEIVVKPLGPLFKNLDVFAGATIMGDGHIALILDVLGTARRSGIIGDRQETASEVASTADEAASVTDRSSILVVETGCGRAAITLETVQRLEEISADALERTGDKVVVQYRGSIMPLVDLASFIDPGRTPDRDGQRLHVVVTHADGDPIGVVVGRVVDIVDDAMHTEAIGRRRGVVGTAVVQGAVTDVVDLDAVVASERAALVGRG